jgi:carbon-monoxide dehydrogenase iron sulfur subunit
MSRSSIICDPDRCIGCSICEFVCSAVKEKSVDPMLSRIRVVNLEPTCSMAITCRLCENPPCVKTCPRDALKQDETTGIIQVNEDKCTGCGWCIKACDFGAISLHPRTGVVMVCDLCGGEPECIKYCPFNEALSFNTVDEMAYNLRRNAVEKLLLELGEM